MANHRFTNNSAVIRLFIQGVLFLKGKSVITQGKRLVKACQDAGLTDVVA